MARWPANVVNWSLRIGAVICNVLLIVTWPRAISYLQTHFPGKTKWDFLERILIPVATPAGVAISIWWLNTRNSIRQEKLSQEQKENDILASFIKEMTPLLLDKGLRSSEAGTEIAAVARALTLATLSRLGSATATNKRSVAIRFLIDSGITSWPANSKY